MASVSQGCGQFLQLVLCELPSCSDFRFLRQGLFPVGRTGYPFWVMLRSLWSSAKRSVMAKELSTPFAFVPLPLAYLLAMRAHILRSIIHCYFSVWMESSGGTNVSLCCVGWVHRRLLSFQGIDVYNFVPRLVRSDIAESEYPSVRGALITPQSSLLS